jgi:hypothetical protein
MIKALLGALFDSLLGFVTGWINRAREEKHRDDAVAMEAIAVSQTERKETEDKIEADSQAARDNAGTDFRSLR